LQLLQSDVLDGLRATPKTLPCKYFYDAAGSKLFEQICGLESYYPTRTELGLMQSHGSEMASAIGPEAILIEFGSGSGLKTRLLLETLRAPVLYAPIEISRETLEAATRRFRSLFPNLEIRPTNADYTQTVSLDLPGSGKRTVYFPGSTIGNFSPPDAEAFLCRISGLVGPRGGLLIGVDLKKDPAILHRAYNDGEGVTARFNLNILHRVNAELDGDVDVQSFRHYAFYNPRRGRVEMHLVCLRDHQATIAGELVAFHEGETIHTENSYKYTLEEFGALASRVGFARRTAWVDDDRLFSVQYFEVEGSRR